MKAGVLKKTWGWLRQLMAFAKNTKYAINNNKIKITT